MDQRTGKAVTVNIFSNTTTVVSSRPFVLKWKSTFVSPSAVSGVKSADDGTGIWYRERHTPFQEHSWISVPARL